MRRLFGVPDVKLDVISALEREKILFRWRSRFRFWSNDRCWHNDLLTLSRSARLPKYKIDNHASQGRGLVSWRLLFFLWRERGDDSFETRIATQRVPKGKQTQSAVR